MKKWQTLKQLGNKTAESDLFQYKAKKKWTKFHVYTRSYTFSFHIFKKQKLNFQAKSNNWNVLVRNIAFHKNLILIKDIIFRRLSFIITILKNVQGNHAVHTKNNDYNNKF